MVKFKQEVLDRIETDPDLFAAVCKALKVKPASLPVTLKRNGNALNQYNIVVLVASQLGVEPDDLVEKEIEEIQK